MPTAKDLAELVLASHRHPNKRVRIIRGLRAVEMATDIMKQANKEGKG